MNKSSNHWINDLSNRWASWFMVLAIIGFAMIMFRQTLVPGQCLFSTDDNIGQMQMQKDVISLWSDGNYTDTLLVGMPSGVSMMNWNGWMVWLLSNKLYINWMHALNMGLASMFLSLFLRRYGIGWAAVCSACLAAFWLGSNLTLTYAGHLGKYGVIMFAGISLYCLSRALSPKTSILWSIITGGAIGFMFLEQLDVALFFGFVLGAYALFLAIRQWQLDGTWAKSAVALIVMGGVGLLLAASTMLGSYASNVKGAASMQTESPQEKWDYVTQWSWPPDECIDFIAPGYTGWRSGEPEGPYWGRMGRSAGWEQTQRGFMNFKLENTYLGIIPILLAIFAILAGIIGYGSKGVTECGGTSVKGVTDSAMQSYANTTARPDSTTSTRTEIIFWGCVAVITLLLAFGKFFPLYALFYKLPLVSSIRNPNKFLQVFQLALGILAAFGLDGMLRAMRARTTVCRGP